MNEQNNKEALVYCSGRWSNLAGRYTADAALVQALWQELEQGYTSPGRYYHNFSHIRYMLEKLDEHCESVADADTLQFSVFYHDLVYSTARSDNEERSADKAAAALQQLDLPAPTIGRCRKQILATKAHAATPDPDTNLLTDIDLAILGEPWPQYRLYTQQVRKEYAVYPDFMYRRGRRNVLEHFLAMDFIYKTATFRERYEQQARKNLQEELLQL